VLIGPRPPRKVTSIEKIIAARPGQTGAQAIHPGYGFLSENPGFADACAAPASGFIGPTPDQMRRCSASSTPPAPSPKHNGAPLLPGTGLLPDVGPRCAKRRIGYPVMLKSTAGGGGIGMQHCARTPAELEDAFAARRPARAAQFQGERHFLEKYVERARHIEVQIFGDGRGHVVALGERDCSVQRRNQKVIEETPAPGLTANCAARVLELLAARLGAPPATRIAGTVEFVFDNATGEFYFLEVNTRLQVEHGVTEEVTGVDLVEWMVRQAAGELDLSNFQRRNPARRSRCASTPRIRARISSRRPACSPNLSISHTSPVETWVERGTEVSPYYDPMLAKLIVKGGRPRRGAEPARTVARRHPRRRSRNQSPLSAPDHRLRRFSRRKSNHPLSGETSLCCANDRGARGRYPNHRAGLSRPPRSLGCRRAAVRSDGHGRSFRLANRLVDNPDTSAAALEITLSGPVAALQSRRRRRPHRRRHRRHARRKTGRLPWRASA
jgi:urea carboxylase